MIKKIKQENRILKSIREESEVYEIKWDYSGKLRDEAQEECDKIANSSNTVSEAWKKVEKSEWRSQIEQNVTFFAVDKSGKRIKQIESKQNRILKSIREESDTFKCPECGSKVLKKTGYCMSCKKKVKDDDKKENRIINALKYKKENGSDIPDNIIIDAYKQDRKIRKMNVNKAIQSVADDYDLDINYVRKIINSSDIDETELSESKQYKKEGAYDNYDTIDLKLVGKKVKFKNDIVKVVDFNGIDYTVQYHDGSYSNIDKYLMYDNVILIESKQYKESYNAFINGLNEKIKYAGKMEEFYVTQPQNKDYEDYWKSYKEYLEDFSKNTNLGKVNKDAMLNSNPGEMDAAKWIKSEFMIGLTGSDGYMVTLNTESKKQNRILKSIKENYNVDDVYDEVRSQDGSDYDILVSNPFIIDIVEKENNKSFDDEDEAEFYINKKYGSLYNLIKNNRTILNNLGKYYLK